MGKILDDEPKQGRVVVQPTDEAARLVAQELQRSGEKNFQVHVGPPPTTSSGGRVVDPPSRDFLGGLRSDVQAPSVAGPGGIMLNASGAIKGGAGASMAYLEMVKGLAQLDPKRFKGVIDWVNREEQEFWKSKEAGGFFGDPWAEAGRIAAHTLTGIVGGKGIQTLLPKLLGVLPGAKAVGLPGRIAESYTGQVATAGGAGAALGVAQPADEGVSKADQALHSALVAMGFQGGFGAIPTIRDLVKQHIGASGQTWLQQINPFNAKTVTTPNPRIDMGKVRQGNMLEMETGTPQTMGQKLGDQELLNREMIANTQPKGITFHQELAGRQARGVEGTARGGLQGQSTPPDFMPLLDKIIPQMKTPTDVRRVMGHLDATDPAAAAQLRQRYVENLISKGEIPIDPIRGPGLSNPQTSFSVSKFLGGRPSESLDYALYDAMLRPQDKAWVEKAYELASRTASHELNPRRMHGAELSRGAQEAQAAVGVLTAPGGAGPIFAARSRFFQGIPDRWRHYLMTKEGQEELVRLTQWERGVPGLMAPAGATLGAAAVRTPGVEEGLIDRLSQE